MSFDVGSLKKSSIAWIVMLVGIYIMLQLVADVTVFKMVTLFGISLPAGSLLYAVTFTWRDLIHKRLGRGWAMAAILTAAVANVAMAIFFIISIKLPNAGFFGAEASDAFDMVLGIVPRVVVASLISEVISELTDTEIYHRVEHKFTGRWQFMRVVLSNMVSAPMDAVVFGMLAFYGTMPMSALISILWGGTLFKWFIGYAVIPLIYLSKDQRIQLEPEPEAA